MIPLIDKNKINNDSRSPITHFDYLVQIISQDRTFYLGTNAFTVDDIFYDDIIEKISGASESIDLFTKKIKLSGTTIVINNGKIDYQSRFSDKIQGEMFGAVVDIYIKSASCDTLQDCIKISSLQITRITHDDKTLTISTEDRYIDEFHKELPLTEDTLYEGVDTFVGDNESRIPILYGHLKEAPAVAIIENNEEENPFTDNNIIIVPDRAFKEENRDIIGIKPISPLVETDSEPNQLIEKDSLKIKLGDSAATVYSTPPDRLHREMALGNSLREFEFDTKWNTQYTVSEDKTHIRLQTESKPENSEYTLQSNLLCGEVSKLIGTETFKTKIYRADDLIINMSDDDYSVPHYSDDDTYLDSTDPVPENYDMLSLPAFYLDDKDTDTNEEIFENAENGILVNINQSNYLFQVAEENFGGFPWTSPVGTHFDFDIPVFQVEFEPLKCSIDQSKGEDDSYSDAMIVGRFKHFSKKVSFENGTVGDVEHLEYAIYPAIGNQETENLVNVQSYSIAQGQASPDEVIQMSEDILGLPSFATGALNTSFTNRPDWFSGYLDGYELNLANFSDSILQKSPLRIYVAEAPSLGATITDHRHTFHTLRQSDSNLWVNTWRNYYESVERINWVNQNIFTGIVMPRFEPDVVGFNQFDVRKLQMAIKANFNGMFLKRVWYQKDVFNKKFFVDAKGKFTNKTSNTLGDGKKQILKAENVSMFYISTEPDSDENLTVARDKTDQALFELYDYLTKDRFKTKYIDGVEYDLVVTASLKNDTDNKIVFYDIDINDFRVIPHPSRTNYLFNFNCKIFRNVNNETDYVDLTDIQGNNLEFIDVQIRYASKNINSATSIHDGWTYFDETDSVETPFVSVNLSDQLTYQKKLAYFSSDFQLTTNRVVRISMGNNHPITSNTGTQHAYAETLILEENKELIRKPTNVIQDIAYRELGINQQVYTKNVKDNNYKLDFSVDKKLEGIEVMENIAKSSPFFYKTQLHSGRPSVIGIKEFYDSNDVDKKININNLFNYKFTKSKKEDVVLECVVKYGYDYVAEEYKKTTNPETTLAKHASEVKQDYIDRYDIKDEKTHVLEHEAQYIQDQKTAEILSKHLFELYKNQHLVIDFSLPIQDALELEVGDVVSFVDNKGNRANIGDVKPFGIDKRKVNIIGNQAAFPFFMITSIKKDLSQVKIKVTQLHELAPSPYDNWTVTDWGLFEFDEETGEPFIPVIPEAPVLFDLQFSVDELFNLDEAQGAVDFTLSVTDADNSIALIQTKLENLDTNEIVYDYNEQNVYDVSDLNVNSIDLQETLQLDSYGNYKLYARAIDYTGLVSNVEVITINYQAFPITEPVATISHVQGLLGVEENAILASTAVDIDIDSYEITLPYNEEGYEVQLSAEQSYVTVPLQGNLSQILYKEWTIDNDSGESIFIENDVFANTVTIEINEDNMASKIELVVTDVMNTSSQNIEVNIEMEPFQPEVFVLPENLNEVFTLTTVGQFLQDVDFTTNDIYAYQNNIAPINNCYFRVQVLADTDLMNFQYVKTTQHLTSDDSLTNFETHYEPQFGYTGGSTTLFIPDGAMNGYSVLASANGQNFYFKFQLIDNNEEVICERRIYFVLDVNQPNNPTSRTENRNGGGYSK